MEGENFLDEIEREFGKFSLNSNASVKLIDKQDKLDKLCAKLKTVKIIALDSEFHSGSSYYAQLSLIQITAGEERAVIDILAKLDLTPLKTLLMDDNILKILHSPHEDFRIFVHIFGQLPKNVFDTQTAAGVCELGWVMGYGNLCDKLLGVEIDKTLQQTDWLRRPLKSELIEYAIKDTEYLVTIYEILSTKLTEKNLWADFKDRMNKIVDEKTYIVKPNKLMSKMKLKETKEFKDKLVNFIALREECAQTNDLPRNVCATEYHLIMICRKLPTSDKELHYLQVHKLPIARGNFKLRLFELCEKIKAALE